MHGTTAVHICFGYAADHPRAAERLLVPARARRLQLPPGVDRNGAIQPRHQRPAQSCADKQILVGCLDLSDTSVETPEVVAGRIRRALEHVPAEQVILAPDCGMKYLPRDVAQGKLQAMVEAARILRREHAG